MSSNPEPNFILSQELQRDNNMPAPESSIRTSVSTKPINHYHREILQRIPPKILDTFIGCGAPIPDSIEGLTIVNVNCGTGRDCFVMSDLSGPSGRVVGIDTREDQIEIAQSAIAYQRAHNPSASPMEFKCGSANNLNELGIADSSIDVVVASCAINLSADKNKFFSEIFRVLKSCGEVCISDIFTDRVLPKKEECGIDSLRNAMDLPSFIEYMKTAGFKDLRAVMARRVTIDGALASAVEPGTRFLSVTFSAFKGIDINDHSWEGEFAQYKSGIAGCEGRLTLDFQSVLLRGVKTAVPMGIYQILSLPRFSRFFALGTDNSLDPPKPIADFTDAVNNLSTRKCCCCCGNSCSIGK